MKKTISVTIDTDLLSKARDNNINISAFLDIKLRKYVAVLNNDTVKQTGLIDKPNHYGSRGLTDNSYNFEEYFKVLELSGITKAWNKTVKNCLEGLIEYCNNDISNNDKVIGFLNELQKHYSISGYRQRFLQIKKMLKYFGITWIDNIKTPKQPKYKTEYINPELVNKTIEFFKSHKQYLRFKAYIEIGIDTGMRAMEIYQLKPCDIDLKNRIIRVNHKPELNQTTKTQESRIVFFTEKTKKTIEDYMRYYNNGSGLKRLFEGSSMRLDFKNAPLHAKQLRKIFSQQWTIKRGDYELKELLLGHSTSNNVDMQHYFSLPPNEIKKLYDEVMG